VKHSLSIGIIGDYDPDRLSHTATGEAIGHAAVALGIAAEVSWLPTPALDSTGSERLLRRFDALWCAPGSPYTSVTGALSAIRFAREHDRPFLGT
jgi:CTP synthase (UTP-ammonia lyase)